MTDIKIRTATIGDAAAIADIYGHYVLNSLATFDETPPAPSYFENKIKDAKHPWLVAYDDNGATLGYCYAGPYRLRAAYRHTVETSIYLAPRALGKRLGTLLMEELLRQLKDDPTPITQLIAGIAVADHDATIGAGSIALHEKLGFKRIGLFSRVGCKFDQWLDVAYYQREL